MNTPKSWNEASAAELKSIRAICLDIDDTLSSHGKLKANAFAALWALKEAGFLVVPITGRPAGWCDHIARFWPVDAVVGENGAFTFYMQDGKLRRMDTPGANADKKSKLEKLGQTVRAKFPHARWASDQAYRENDLAIDICEDVTPWNPADVDALLSLCHGTGAHAKLSSIHVNAWYGDYDKRKGFDSWLAQGCPGLPKGTKIPAHEEWLYIGDSPNDEPMFKTFHASVGVANLRQYLDRLKFPPKWITASESGDGFAEMAKKMTDARRG